MYWHTERQVCLKKAICGQRSVYKDTNTFSFFHQKLQYTHYDYGPDFRLWAIQNGEVSYITETEKGQNKTIIDLWV